MYYRFENLEVWKLGRKFVTEVYKITSEFPKEELFGLTSQIRRAALSIVLNIAEGSDRKSDLEFKRFLRMSVCSVNEVITGLYVAIDLKIISVSQFNNIYELSGELSSRIKALINSLK